MFFTDGKAERSENKGEQLVIIDRPQDVTVPAGNDVYLQCKTEDPHNTQLLWTLNGSEISPDARISINSTTLSIHSSKKEDSGTYTCLATSNGLSAEASSRVLVTGSKLIEYGPSNQSILIGSNVHIPCKLSDEFASRNDLWTSWKRNVSCLTYLCK